MNIFTNGPKNNNNLFEKIFSFVFPKQIKIPPNLKNHVFQYIYSCSREKISFFILNDPCNKKCFHVATIFAKTVFLEITKINLNIKHQKNITPCSGVLTKIISPKYFEKNINS